ncbi:hypothetical protein BGX27_001491 [Mortierella sp. AM989]|nr:hypothetical protein BGX27_001491 [Mortierella sp. AM989]
MVKPIDIDALDATLLNPGIVPTLLPTQTMITTPHGSEEWSESMLLSGQTPASTPRPSSITPACSSESSAALDIENIRLSDIEYVAETPEAVVGQDDEEAGIECELRFKLSNNIRGKSRTKEAPLLTHSCETHFESEALQIKHYLEHVIAQGPYLQCPVISCRMAFLSDSEMTEHSRKWHPQLSPPSSQPTPQKIQQQSKQKRTRLQSKGGKANSITPVISTVDAATVNPLTQSKLEPNLRDQGQKKKLAKPSRSLRSERNTARSNNDMYYTDEPKRLGQLFTR